MINKLISINEYTVSEVIYVTSIFRSNIENVTDEFIAQAINDSWDEWVTFRECNEAEDTDSFWMEIIRKAKPQYINTKKFFNLLRGNKSDKALHKLITTSNYSTILLLHEIYPELIEGYLLAIYKSTFEQFLSHASLSVDDCSDEKRRLGQMRTDENKTNSLSECQF